MSAPEKKPLLAVSLGCPSGIGPEVAVVAAKESRARLLFVGDFGVTLRAAEARADRGAAEIYRFVRVASPAAAFDLPDDVIAVYEPVASLRSGAIRLGHPSVEGGAAQLAWVNVACDLARDGIVDGMVTGPVSKEAIVRSGAVGSKSFLGHTEHLQRRLRSSDVVMAFHSDKLTTALVTTHLPIKKVPAAITAVRVEKAVYWLTRFLIELGVGRPLAPRRGRSKAAATGPRIAVAGLNPHAGEGGLLGTEERTRIAPGIERARKRLKACAVTRHAAFDLVGPVPAESAYRLAAAGDFDAVVAMYHDQATIPMKLVGFGEAVNVSLGLPIVRTSVDHGTAYDRAADFDADARGMAEAIDLAVRMAQGRARPR